MSPTLEKTSRRGSLGHNLVFLCSRVSQWDSVIAAKNVLDIFSDLIINISSENLPRFTHYALNAYFPQHHMDKMLCLPYLSLQQMKVWLLGSPHS